MTHDCFVKLVVCRTFVFTNQLICFVDAIVHLLYLLIIQRKRHIMKILVDNLGKKIDISICTNCF